MVQIKYSKRLSDVAGYINGDILPYTNLYVPDETLGTANVDFNFEDIEWSKDSSSQCTVDLMIKGNHLNFWLTTIMALMTKSNCYTNIVIGIVILLKAYY